MAWADCRASRRLLRAGLGVAAAFLLLSGAASAEAAPTIEATWVTNVTASSATLRAKIKPEGVPANYRFEYVSQAAWEVSGFASAALAPVSGGASLGGGNQPVKVAQSVFSLSPSTSYRYRVRATDGTVAIGPERSLTTEVGSNVFQLPDGRAWEMVSPLDKGGGAIAGPGTALRGAFQAAAAGTSITYSSPSSLGGGEGFPGADQYLSTRGSSGWSTTNITAPTVSGSYGDEPDGVPYRLFSSDLSAGLLSNGVRCRSVGTRCPVANPPLPGSGALPGYRNYYLRSSSGASQALLTSANIDALTLAADEFELALAGATPDLAHVILSTCAKLTAEATEVPAPGGCDENKQNLYEWSGGTLRLLNLLPGDSTGTPGARLAAPAGAISGDGSRVYFTELEDGGLYLSEPGQQTKLLPETVGGGASFQVGSSDGLVAFFTLGSSLYRYDATAETSTAIAAGVTGVLGASADGSYVYFQSTAGLQQWHGGTITEIAAGADAAAPGNSPPTTGAARVSADGTRLAFLSEAELTDYENVDAGDGTETVRDTEVFLYREPSGGAPGSLICASCNPTGERPIGPSSIPGAVVNGSTRIYKPRVLSADGNRLFFDSADRLAVADTDSVTDVYEWEAQGTGDCARAPGCVGLISQARTEGASFIDASSNGDDVFFLTGESSVGADPGSVDVYDARVGGGIHEPPKPLACVGDACQALPSPPDDPTPGTLVPNAGNPPLRITKHKARKHKRRRKGHRHHSGHGRGTRQ